MIQNRFFHMFLFSVTVMLPYLVQAEDGRIEVSRIESNIKCESDKDCTKVSAHCCGCICPVAVNKDAANEYAQQLRKVCQGFQGKCCSSACPAKRPVCVKKSCQLEEVKPEKESPFPARL